MIKSLFIIASILLSSLTMAQDLSCTQSGDQLIVTGHGFEGRQSRYQVNFYGPHENTHIMTQNGSFSYTTPRRFFRDRNEATLTIKVLDFLGSGQHFERSCPYYARANRPDPTPPNPTPEIPRRTIQRYADVQARTVANRVANTYGEFENWRYNFVVGFHQARLAHRVFNMGNDNYRRGRTQGESRGEGLGAQKGEQDAQSRATELAESDAFDRFRQAVENQSEPALDVRVPSVAYSGATTSYDVQRQLNEDIRELDRDLQTRLRLLMWNYDGLRFGYGAWGRTWHLSDIMSLEGNYSFVDSWFRADYAYDEWRQNNLGGSYDHNLYNRMNSEEKSYFRSQFRSVYDNVIDEKFHRVKTRSNYTARTIGAGYGHQVGEKESFHKGYRDGLLPAYQTASRDSFHSEFTGRYTQAFDRKVDYYQNSPHLRLSVRLTDENGNGIFEPNEKIGIQGTITNFGGVSAENIQAYVQGDSIRTLNRETVASVPRLSRQTISLNELATINANITPDQAHAVRVVVGGSTTSLTIRIGWEDLLRKFSEGETRSEDLEALILQTVEAEWLQCLGQWRNWYRIGVRHGEKTQLEKLVDFALTHRSRNLRHIHHKLFKIQEKGGGWHPFKRRSFRGVLERLLEL